MAKKAKKKIDKKEPKRKVYKPIKDEQGENVVNEETPAYRTAGESEIVDDDDLTPEQIKELKEALKEADRGETITWEEFKKMTDRWR